MHLITWLHAIVVFQVKRHFLTCINPYYQDIPNLYSSTSPPYPTLSSTSICRGSSGTSKRRGLLSCRNMRYSMYVNDSNLCLCPPGFSSPPDSNAVSSHGVHTLNYGVISRFIVLRHADFNAVFLQFIRIGIATVLHTSVRAMNKPIEFIDRGL